MAREPSAALRRVIDAADPVTGRVRGTQAQLTALVARGLAFRHPRPPHAVFLTPAGHRVRGAAATDTPGAPRERPGASGGDSGVFTARIGGEPGGAEGPDRARQVHSAWQGLLEMRRMTRQDRAADRLCDWERGHLVPAAALALEAAGCRPATGEGTDGYRVTPSAQPEAVTVHAPPEALAGCTRALEHAGWQVTEHRLPRTAARCLLASPLRG